jgi:hypothetical protein
LFALDSSTLEPEYYRYAQSLRAINQNDKANEVMELFSQNQPMMVEPNFLNKIPIIYKPLKLILEGTLLKMLGINSIYSDYGTAIYSNKLVLLRPEILVVLDNENTNGSVFYKFIHH